VLLIAAVVVAIATQQQIGGFTTVYSPIDGNRNVALQQPILVSFNQPMDHQATEQAVQITPATTVSYSWDQNTLAVTPAGGNLAPNTQYQVTIGPGAKTASGKQLAAPQTITFVTQPPPSPTPTPSPRPTPSSALGEKQVASLGGATGLNAQWSSDSASIYFIDGKGALDVVAAKGGAVTVIAPDGASSPAVSPTGDRLAYIRGGKIEILTFAAGKTDEIVPPTAPTVVGWAKGKVVWATSDAIHTTGDNGPVKVAQLPATGVVKVLSIAPDGGHIVFSQDNDIFILDVAADKSTQLGQSGTSFIAWAPDSTLLLYSTSDHIVVADPLGVTQSTLPTGDASWSSQDAILLGSDTDLYQIRPDGSSQTKLSSGTYHSPLWAPDGSSFAFVRGNALWVGVAPALPPQPTAVDEASSVVKAFMDGRLKASLDQASALLDDTGKKDYGTGKLNLLITGDPHFTRYYVLTQEAIATQPDMVRFVVRLVLTHGKIDVAEYEETLVLVRDAASKHFLVDHATAAPQRNLGKGAEVVSVDVAVDTIKVTFDSDLDPGTVKDGVVLLDSKGRQLDTTASYANRTLTLSGLELKEGAQYRLVVLTTVRDVLGHNVAAEYDLDLAGPSPKKHGNHRFVISPSPSASPTPNG
jgi:Tol biopolymer transport system component